MTSHEADSDSVADVPADRAPAGRDRLVYRVVAALGVMPIVVEVVRRGVTGWIPALDAAPTVFRAKYALGTSPTLVGMFTDSSRYADAATYFPAAWQLYWLWAPIRLLGITWGPLVGMGALNIGWLLLAGWFVKRRLGYRVGAAALVFAALLNWVLSPGLLVSPVPMVMVVPAFVTFLFGSWALAAGDEGVLPLLAVVANFLILDHLVLAVLVPSIGIVAVGCWAVGLFLERRTSDARTWPERRRRSLLAGAGALAVTVLMWLPVLVQQFTNSPGNLTNLWRAGGSQPDAVLSVTDAIAKWLSLFTAPNFWLRPSRTTSYLLSSASPPSTAALVAVAVGFVCLGGFLAWGAFRRRDRAVLAALVLATAGSIAACATIIRAVGPLENPFPAYVQSTWVVAMFVTFAFCFALVRAVPGRARGWSAAALPVAAAVVAALNLPHAAVTSGVTVASDQTIERSSYLNRKVIDAVGETGSVAVRTSGYGAYPYSSAVIVALDDAGIRFCASTIDQFEPSPIPGCHWSAAFEHEIRFVRGNGTADTGKGWRVLATVTSLTEDERAELADSTDHLTAAIAEVEAKGGDIRIAPEFRELADTEDDLASIRANVADDTILNPPGGLISTPEGRQRLALLVHMFEDIIRAHPRAGYPASVAPVQLPGVSRSELVRWADLTERSLSDTGSVLIRSRG
ncbi:MAG TPA: hypothetical protein VFN21_04745 [Acidimicrobiales bacterium]|nr:hypothetical protein [Acidimicrobiales bacterium]